MVEIIAARICSFLRGELMNTKQIVTVVMFLEILDETQDTITIVAPGVSAHPLRQCFMNSIGQEMVHCLLETGTYDGYDIVCLAFMREDAATPLVSCATGRHESRGATY